MAAKAAIQTAAATARRATAATPSRPRIHAAASTPHVNAKSTTITTWTIHVDITSDCGLAERVVREPRVNPARAVDELRHAQVDHGAGQPERLAPLQAVLPAHEVEHAVDRDRSSLVEILVEAERQPCLRRPRDRPRELEVVAHGQREHRALDRCFD